jgi:TPR repeat protein
MPKRHGVLFAKALTLFLTTLLFSSVSWAQVEESADKDVGDCDRFASIDDIPSKGIKKASYGFIDVGLALPPCKAANAKYPRNSRVQVQLARIYFQQGKFEQGIELAKASAKEQAISLAFLGEASRRGVGGVPMNPREAARLFQEGADRGNPESMNGLSRAYAIGIGVEKDEPKALALMQKAAATGDGNSSISMSILQLQGKLGLSKSPIESAKFVQMLADSGTHPGAQVIMGIIIADREKKITSEAAAYFASAVEKLERLSSQESAEARVVLAGCYRLGAGVKKDLGKAFDLYRKAAEHNLIAAIAQTGVALAEGAGTEKNVPEGKKWLERASAMGSDEADKALAKLWGK